MDLNRRLLETPAASERKHTPTVVFDGCTATIETGTVEQEPGQPPEYRELLRQVGRDPDRFRLVSIDYEKHWQVAARELLRDEAGEPLIDDSGKAVYGELRTKWLASYKLRVEQIDVDGPSDLEALITAARHTDAFGSGGPHWYVFQAGDLQLGKRSRDGSTEQIIERFVQSVAAAKRELRLYAHVGIAGVQISMPGDCIEGVVSQGGRNGWLTQETITEQVRILRRLMLYAIDELRGADRLYLDVVNGNHCEAQRQWNTYPGDGWATEAAIAVSDAMKLNTAAYGHVEVRVPEKWSGHMTVPVGDSVVCVIHGHQFKQRAKALTWWSEQAVHNQPPGAAHVLQHGHFHTHCLESHRTKTIVGSPTFDCGSDHYREAHGAESRRGAVTYLLRAGEVSRMGVV
ncbi:hypothetical protein BKG86_17280 [Mycobacteroides chelonae]|uniref:hypothetical protein n=1 Tax=Mycobacteroides chelonae TaxID=1774 RepID=UPI0008A99AC0|nr:hypothetical protein [Mycobacteroides chelonae]OHU71404.1 hypothetical protein BKG86_17280 [Mycobacteroides chelonae]